MATGGSRRAPGLRLGLPLASRLAAGCSREGTKDSLGGWARTGSRFPCLTRPALLCLAMSFPDSLGGNVRPT